MVPLLSTMTISSNYFLVPVRLCGRTVSRPSKRREERSAKIRPREVVGGSRDEDKNTSVEEDEDEEVDEEDVDDDDHDDHDNDDNDDDYDEGNNGEFDERRLEELPDSEARATSTPNWRGNLHEIFPFFYVTRVRFFKERAFIEV
jgi:hypothetical protein